MLLCQLSWSAKSAKSKILGGKLKGLPWICLKIIVHYTKQKCCCLKNPYNPNMNWIHEMNQWMNKLMNVIVGWELEIHFPYLGYLSQIGFTSVKATNHPLWKPFFPTVSRLKGLLRLRCHTVEKHCIAVWKSFNVSLLLRLLKILIIQIIFQVYDLIMNV